MDRDGVSAECYFLDVGQGTCQVILLGKGRAIVIDTGPDPDARVPLDLLRTEGITSLELLIISHNDRDHDAGAPAILETYGLRHVGGVCLIRDRRKEHVRLYKKWMSVNEMRLKSGLPKIPLIDLERNDDRPKIVYKDDASRIEIEAVHPNFEAEFHWDTEPNAMCAVLRLECGSRRILFTGDVPAKVWFWMIRERLIQPPVHCDIMTVPHHGGHAGSKPQLRRLYTQGIRCEHAIVNVGTTNGEGHPTERGIGAIRDAKVNNILCTQLTERCCSVPNQSHPGGLIVPHRLSRSHPLQNPDGDHVACAGTVVARIKPGKIAITNPDLTVHRGAVDGLVTATRHPLCRA